MFQCIVSQLRKVQEIPSLRSQRMNAARTAPAEQPHEREGGTALWASWLSQKLSMKCNYRSQYHLGLLPTGSGCLRDHQILRPAWFSVPVTCE